MGKGKGEGAELCVICGAMTFCCLVVLLVIALIGFGIAKIVMGSVYLHDCDIEYLIPIYLIVSGVAPIFFGGFGRQDDSNDNLCGPVCGVIGLLFNLAWLICGSVWVYPNFGKLNAVDFKQCTANVTDNCLTASCNKDLATFAFAAVTIDWFFMGLWIGLIGYILGKMICGR